MECLEILLLLRAHSARAWKAGDVADELRSNADSSARWLARLEARGLVQAVDGAYRWAPYERARAAADVLAAEYAERRFSVIDRILRRGSSSVRAFADAFRIIEREDT